MLLYAALLLRAISLAQKFLWSAFETETSIFGLLYFDIGVPETLALLLDNAFIWMYLIAAAVLIVTSQLELNRLRCPALLVCVFWELLLVVAIVYRDDAFQRFLTPATHALRIATPLVLLLLCRRAPTKWLTHTLRWAIALTFLGHGLNAWLHHPEYATYILATVANLFGMELGQTSVENGLRAIAVLDIAAAAGVVLVGPAAKYYRGLLGYAAIWGLVTAASRMTTSGVFVWHETLLRASHFLGPPALICLCYQWVRSDVATLSESNNPLV